MLGISAAMLPAILRPIDTCTSSCTECLGALLIRLLVQDHDQSVDPNLVKLADAYDIASSKLKDLSEQKKGPAGSIQRLNTSGGHSGGLLPVSSTVDLSYNAFFQLKRHRETVLRM